MITLLQALLTRLAKTPAGARELLAANCIGYLTQCHYIDLRPDHHDDLIPPGNLLEPSGSGFVPTTTDRYRQLLLPLLKLLLTMLTCPGSQRSEVKSQVSTLIHLTFDLIIVLLCVAGDVTDWSAYRNIHCNTEESQRLRFHGSTGGVVIGYRGDRSLRSRSGLE